MSFEVIPIPRPLYVLSRCLDLILFALCHTRESVIPAFTLQVAFPPHLPAAILPRQDLHHHTYFDASDVDRNPTAHPS